MVPSFMRNSLMAVASAAVLTGCASVREYTAPKFPFLGSYGATKSGAAKVLNHSDWWRGMHDPALNKLVALALTDSLSLSLARERVVAARAQRRAVPGSLSVTSSTGARAEGVGSDGPDVTGQGDIGLNWLLDPWGARREELRAADARIEIAQAELDAARLLVLFNLNNAYIELRYRQKQLVLLRQELSRGNRALNLINQRLEAKSATKQDVIRARARLASSRAQMPDLEAMIAGHINEISVLTGRVPGTLPGPLRAALRAHTDQPTAAMAGDIGIPADLLRNRPDLRISERRYYVALAQVEVARASLYPTLSLTGLISLDNVGSSRPEYFLGPTLRFPTLPLDAARASVEVRHSEVRQAHETWKSDVLSAILQVENALLEYNGLKRGLSSAQQATRLYREAATLTRELLSRNDATISDLLDAQDEVAGAARSEADLRFRAAQSFVEVNVRLGAGAKSVLGTGAGKRVRRAYTDPVVVASDR